MDASRALDHLIRELAASQLGSPIFSPHVTLLHPIASSWPLVAIVSAVHQAVASIRQQHSAFDWSLDVMPAQRGEQYYQSVIAPMRPHPALTKLRKACEEHFGLKDLPTYLPHLSLIYGDLSGEARKEIATRANSGPDQLPAVMRFQDIAVVKVEGLVEDWEIVARVPL